MPCALRTRRMKRSGGAGRTPMTIKLRWLLPILVAGLAAALALCGCG
jgi:hypothetical protein